MCSFSQKIYNIPDFREISPNLRLWSADRWRWQRWRRPTNGLPDLQAALGTFVLSGSAPDSRLHHCWCELVQKSSWACSWLWCFDYREACSCRSVQLVLWMSFISSVPPLPPSMLAPGWPPGPQAREMEAATRPRGPYRRIQPGKVNLTVSSRKWDLRGMLESDCRRVVLGRKWNRHVSTETSIKSQQLQSRSY